MHADINDAGTRAAADGEARHGAAGQNSPDDLETHAPVEPGTGKGWILALVLVFGAIIGAYLLLWSPWWTPLSDSSLFIALARNMDEGRGYTYMGRPHQLVTPLTPAMLWGLMRVSRSFALMNASMIACMLGSFVFMYIALKEWLDRRTALMLTAVSALGYWQFRLATVIGSDQPFLLLYWMAMYFVVLARGRRQGNRMFVPPGSDPSAAGALTGGGSMLMPPGSDPFHSRFWCGPRPGMARLPDTLTELRGPTPSAMVDPPGMSDPFACPRGYMRLPCGRRRMLWLSLATAGLLLGIGFRIAGVVLIPVIGLGLWLDSLGVVSLWRRAGMVAGVTMPLLLAGGTYWLWQGTKRGPDQQPREYVPLPKSAAVAASQLAAPRAAVASPADSLSEITTYSPRLRILALPVYQWPGVPGRWLAEALVAPSRAVFLRVGPIGEAFLGGAIAVIAATGVWVQVRARRWWLVVPILYVLAFAVLWGPRYIPRYMVPVTPMIILWLASGTAAIAGKMAGMAGFGSGGRRLRRITMAAVPVVVLLCNLPVLAAEIHVRRGGDFHGRLRQGATAELVDAAAYIRRRLPKDVVVCTNDSIRRREVHLLTGRAVAALDQAIADPSDDRAIRRFFAVTGASCAVIRYTGLPYPEWHFDVGGHRPDGWTWWGLYVWDARRNRPVKVYLRNDRQWSLQLPDSGI